MEITRLLLERVAGLARLNLTDKEKDYFIPQLKEILEAFSKIDEVDTSSTEMSIQPIVLKDAFREDVPEACLKPEEALTNTQHKKDTYFMGPRAI
jgi:aspartyl-tRNA(Asn)/glutamyl-tRNA(Gln) amidotransferase subunit C